MKNTKTVIILILLGLIISQRVLSREISMEPYGFIKTSVMYGTDPILSFKNTNMVAPTSAANKDLYNSGNDRTAFQVAQSRLGTKIKHTSGVKGVVEIDFIDFNQSSPTTQSRPRLRRAFISKALSHNTTLQIGQDWDTFSPLRPDTFDIIGLYFNGGNVGFMREQVKLVKKLEKGRLEFSIGQANKNTAPSNNEVEEKNQLSMAFNYQYLANEHNTFVISSIMGRSNDYQGVDKSPFGSTIGYTYKDPKTQLVLEGYYGEGLDELNVLDLPGGTFGESFGGYITFQRSLRPDLFLRLGQGYAKRNLQGTSTLNSDKTYSNLALKKNMVSRLAIAKTYEHLQIYTEVSHFNSQFNRSSQAQTIEWGLLMPF
jgi:hypothetical protein